LITDTALQFLGVTGNWMNDNHSRVLILNPVISNIMTIENNNNRFFNLSDITSRVQAILQPHMGKHFWVKAEIASGRERGGSFYCDLVETDGNGKIIAQIRCTI
jgi:hypothetical protein